MRTTLLTRHLALQIAWICIASISARAEDTDPNALEATLLFGSGSADLDVEMRARLDGIATAMRSAPTTWRLLIEGHADALGDAALNQDLARLRADRVADTLTRRGVPRARLEVIAYGEARPAASNETPEGRAQNRRVVVRVDVGEAPAETDETAEASTPTATAPVEPVEAASDEPAPAQEPSAPEEGSEPAPEPSHETAAEPTPRTDASSPPAVAGPVDVVAAGPVSTRGEGRSFRLPFSRWWAVAPAVVGVAAALGSAAFFVDHGFNSERLDADRVQLKRTDLLPESRAAFQGHARKLEDALVTDVAAGTSLGVAATVAVGTAVAFFVFGEE